MSVQQVLNAMSVQHIYMMRCLFFSTIMIGLFLVLLDIIIAISFAQVAALLSQASADKSWAGCCAGKEGGRGQCKKGSLGLEPHAATSASLSLPRECLLLALRSADHGSWTHTARWSSGGQRGAYGTRTAADNQRWLCRLWPPWGTPLLTAAF